MTTPSSSTALPPAGEAILPLESELITEQSAKGFGEIGPNASVPANREGRRGSGWLGSLRLAFSLGMQAFDPPSTFTRWLVCGSGSSVYSKSEATVAREDLLAAFERTSLDDVEDGMSYDLGVHIAATVQRYHEIAITTLAELILSGETSEEVVSHALRWLGRMEDRTTESSRLRLLHRGLKAASPVVRDGAALGLAALGAPESIPMLRKAVQEEHVRGLRRDLERVLRELEERR